ncbi:MAG TPA: hypothetical protein VNN08_20335 [Thermoanaerobaculia bacterium]|nr:hypothetical protein [Thermoanaerobaculia bacterium]
MEPSENRLVHYTSSPDVVASILENGFLLVPNKRGLINYLLGEETFPEREPQQFGMVSFTQLPFDRAGLHRKRFGDFGIVVCWEWALQNGAERVTYVDERGATAEAYSWLFRFAKQELEEAAGGSVSGLSLENLAVASFAKSTIWSRMLRLYEYMEPEHNSPHVEWRIVNSVPQYHRVEIRSQLIAELLEEVKRWRGHGSVRISPNDIHAFICPRHEVRSLASVLPNGFGDVPILPYGDRLRRLQALRERAVWGYRGRERIVKVLTPPPAGTHWLWKNSDDAFQLPDVGLIRGVHLRQDEVQRNAIFLLQYEDVFGRMCDLAMQIGPAFTLLDSLERIRQMSGLHPTRPLPWLQRPRDLLIGRVRMGVNPPPGRRSR